MSIKLAAVDIAGPMLVDGIRFLLAAGLQVTGSLDRGVDDGSGIVRLILLDELGGILPDACADRMHLISPIFVAEGADDTVKLSEVHLVGPL